MKTRLTILLAFLLAAALQPLPAQTDTVRLSIGTAELTDAAKVICLPVTADVFPPVAGLQTSIGWDPAQAEFDSINFGDNPLLLNASHWSQNVPGQLAVAWTHPTGDNTALEDGTVLLNVCLKPLVDSGTVRVAFTSHLIPEFITPELELYPFIFTAGGLVFVRPVYPGDTNADGIVDNRDLLPIGIAFGTEGPARDSASLNFIAQYTPHWPQTLPGSGTNYQHIDTDGDGTIGASDTAAISLNWTRTVRLTNPEQPRSAGPPLFVQKDTVPVGELAALDIMLGTVEEPATAAYGLAFTLFFDPTRIEPGSFHLDFTDGWLGEAVLGVYRADHNRAELSVAITRTDGQNAAGHGRIARLYLRPKAPAGVPQHFALNFTLVDILLQDAHAGALPVTGRTTAVTVDNAVAVTEPAWGHQVRLYPNPTANGWLRLEAPGVSLSYIEILNTEGRVVKKINPAGQLNVTELSSGNYYLRLHSEDGKVTRAFSKL